MRSIVIKTRDSVCAGDDAEAPHEIVQQIDRPITDAVKFTYLTTRKYLASVNGTGHSWTAILNGVPIARITIDMIDPFVGQISLAEENTLHFKYHSATF